MLGDLFNRLGSTVGSLDAHLRGMMEGTGAGGSSAEAGGPDGLREVAVYDPETGEVHDIDGDYTESMETAALAAAGAWLLSRFLRPHEVSWTRVVFAGIAATALADLVGRTEERSSETDGLPFARDPEELMARFGAGVAIAAGYAALLYPRLPGPPLLKGLGFGALEILAAPRGGLMAMAAAAPGVKFPLQALAVPVDEDAGPLSHLAFGLALGMLYRYDLGEEDYEEE